MAGIAVDAPRAPDELSDIQALLRAGFAALTEAAFLLLRVADADAARRWLGQAKVTSVGDLGTRQNTVLQVALTAAGMRALAIPEAVIAGFSAEFIAGLAGDPARSRRLGDIGPDAPAQWDWGSAEREPHVLVLLYALPGQLAMLRASLDGPDFAAGFAVVQTLETSDMGGHEPFGFLDGVSQPTIDWAGQRKPDTDADLDYGNLITPGEFVLGYRNEYGLLTERPLLDTREYPQATMLPPAADAAWLRDLGRNGSYLVLRTLRQDVRGFWRFMMDHRDLAERIVGRKLDGSPLVPTQDAPIRGVGPDAADRAQNQFTFLGDPDGLVCPIGAHVRRANPRTGDMPGGRMGWFGQLMCLAGFGGHTEADRVAASRFHRLLRRGREYGALLPAAQAQAPDAPDPEAGLHFICLAANISRQFEFVQNAWLQSSKFAGLHGEADPLTANRAPLAQGSTTDAFGLPLAELPEMRVAALPRFVGVRGGAYFFLPGLRALRFLAGVTATEAVAPSALWQETASPDEAAQIAAFCAEIRTYQQGFARRGDGQVRRGFHVKSHTGLQARFTVLDDIPPEAKHGIFKTARTFDARVRLSNGFSSPMPDWFPDLVGCAVKLLGVEGAKLLEGEEEAGSQDFVALNQPYLPADNPAQLMLISTAPSNPLTAPFKMVQGLGFAHAAQVVWWALKWSLRRIPLGSVTTEDFYSGVPITIGPHAVKFKWQSHQKTLPLAPGASWLNYLRDDLRRRLLAGDLRFDFLVQFYADPVTTPIDGAYAWNAPFVKLAELTIPSCDIDSYEAKAEEHRLRDLSFNPWHAIAEHRPIGNIQRARREVYRASAMFRARDADPPVDPPPRPSPTRGEGE